MSLEELMNLVVTSNEAYEYEPKPQDNVEVDSSLLIPLLPDKTKILKPFKESYWRRPVVTRTTLDEESTVNITNQLIDNLILLIYRMIY